MQLEDFTDTTTPSDSTQLLLCNGAIRTTLKSIGAAIVVGSAVVEGQGYYCEMPPSTVRHTDKYQGRGDMSFGIAEHLARHQVARVDPDTQGIAPEFVSYLRPTGAGEAPDVAPAVQDIEYSDIRLTPPSIEEHRIRVRFRSIGEEAPRIWVKAETE